MSHSTYLITSLRSLLPGLGGAGLRSSQGGLSPPKPPLDAGPAWTKEKKNWTVAQWSKVLFSDKSIFCISFRNQGPRVWRKIWAAMSSAGVGLLCFIKSTVNAAIYQENLEHFMLPSADKLYEDADILFQQDFSTCPHC